MNIECTCPQHKCAETMSAVRWKSELKTNQQLVYCVCVLSNFPLDCSVLQSSFSKGSPLLIIPINIIAETLVDLLEQEELSGQSDKEIEEYQEND